MYSRMWGSLSHPGVLALLTSELLRVCVCVCLCKGRKGWLGAGGTGELR